MVYDSVLFTLNTPRVAGAFETAQERGGLTQELVILVILIVIALALILMCGFMGRRKEEEVGEGVGRAKTELKPVQAEPVTKEAGVAKPEGPVVTSEPAPKLAEPFEVQEPVAPSEPVTKLAEPSEVRESVAPSEPVSKPAEPSEVRESIAPSEPVSKLAEPPVEKVKPATAASRPDDLKVVEGIGPKVSRLLNEAGIFTFAQLAEADPVHLKQILDAAKLTMMNPESWPEQARLAANGDWDGLKVMQDQLKGGRH